MKAHGIAVNNNSIMEIMRELERQRDGIFLAEIKKLVEDGLLIETRGEGVVFESMDITTGQHKYEYKQAIGFKFRDQEVIDKLKAENEALKASLQKIREALG